MDYRVGLAYNGTECKDFSIDKAIHHNTNQNTTEVHENVNHKI